jgi:hypothetical protein
MEFVMSGHDAYQVPFMVFGLFGDRERQYSVNVIAVSS